MTSSVKITWHAVWFLAALALASAGGAWAQEEEPDPDEDAPSEEEVREAVRESVQETIESLERQRRQREERQRQRQAAPDQEERAFEIGQGGFEASGDLPEALPTECPRGNFRAELSQRQETIAATEGEERAEAVYAMARFLYGCTLFGEAASVINYMEELSEFAEFDPKVQLLQEAALAAAGELDYEDEEALAFLSALGHPDAVMWSGVLASRAQDWETAASLGRSGGVDRALAYAWPWRASIAAHYAEAFTEMQAYRAADRTITSFQPEDLSRSRAGQFYPDGPAALLRARGLLEEARRRFQSALTAYDQAAEGSDYNAYDSAYRAAMLRYDLGLNDSKTTADRLNALTYAWRGDDVEARALLSLADIRQDQGRLDLQLRPLAMAALRLDDADARVRPFIEDAKRRLLRTMRSIYVEGEGPDDPVVLLDMYERFRRALGDTEGFEVVDSAVVEFLEDNGLNGAAYSVARRMEARTYGDYRARTYLLAAEYHLKNDRYRRALEAVDAAEIVLASDDEQRGRERVGARGRILRAQALHGLGREAEAYDLLREEDTAESFSIMGDLAWSEEDWQVSADGYREARLKEGLEAATDENLTRERLALFLSGAQIGIPPRPETRPWSDVITALFGPSDAPQVALGLQPSLRQGPEGGDLELPPGGGEGTGTAEQGGAGQASPALEGRAFRLGVSPELLAELDPALLAAVEADERALRQARRLRAEAEGRPDEDAEAELNENELRLQRDLRARELEESLSDVDALIAYGQTLVEGNYPSDLPQPGDGSEENGEANNAAGDNGGENG
jgi:hypothetical protein